ncbi:MAG: hypothetical protein IIV18_01125 [Lachnospiraceae bacterium]|nr:hypothetical protein [Lachnospiraceae bacterium]
MDRYVLKNKTVPSTAQAVIDRMKEQGEDVLFVIVGDLNLKGKYAESSLIFTWDKAVRVDGEERKKKQPSGSNQTTDGDALQKPTVTEYLFSDMTEVVSKRMYGNATLSAIMPDGRREIFFRYTYSVAALCDAAAESARALGYQPLVLTTTLSCEAKEAGAMLASILLQGRQLPR